MNSFKLIQIGNVEVLKVSTKATNVSTTQTMEMQRRYRQTKLLTSLKHIQVGNLDVSTKATNMSITQTMETQRGYLQTKLTNTLQRIQIGNVDSLLETKTTNMSATQTLEK